MAPRLHKAHQTVGVETVLSTPKYRKFVRLAKSYGFEIRLLYVLLKTADLNVQRVKMRVAKGGHAVAENKIRERRERSLNQLPWFLDQTDIALIYDNSTATPKLVGRKQSGLLEIDHSAPDELKHVAAKIKD